jgi:hypothetical protein
MRTTIASRVEVVALERRCDRCQSQRPMATATSAAITTNRHGAVAAVTPCTTPGNPKFPVDRSRIEREQNAEAEADREQEQGCPEESPGVRRESCTWDE